MDKTIPGYVNLYNSNELRNRVELLKEKLESCTLCNHKCKVNRVNGERGFCGAGENMVITCYGPHYGEEDQLVGTGGSGTIFFSYCTMRCVFCQNYDISHYPQGDEESPERLADIMMELQNKGCHNINMVSPTHFIPQIVEGIYIAAQKGLHIPIVYNTGGYEDYETIKLLDGVIDIYMPDIKFEDNHKAFKYTKCKNYFDTVKIITKEIHRQVGDLKVNEQGIATKGLLIRHLVMPNNVEDSKNIMRFIENELSNNTVVNIMKQYTPMHKACDFSEISRKVNEEEFKEVVEYAQQLGMKRLIIF